MSNDVILQGSFITILPIITIKNESSLNQVTKSLSDLTRNDVLPGAFPTGYKMEF